MYSGLPSRIDLNPLAEEVDEVADRLEAEGPDATLAWTFERFGDTAAIATGFGPEGLVAIDIAMSVADRPRVFFVDTGFLFPETYEVRTRLERRYGIEIEAAEPLLSDDAIRSVHGPALWTTDPDRCCAVRKLEPLARYKEGLSAWVTGIRRDQTAARASARVVEWDAKWGLVKVNPLAAWSREQVWDYVLDHGLPYNPLHDRGYPSLGCTHCTRPVAPGEHERSGRWAGFEKTECGLHGRFDKE